MAAAPAAMTARSTHRRANGVSGRVVRWGGTVTDERAPHRIGVDLAVMDAGDGGRHEIACCSFLPRRARCSQHSSRLVRP